MTRVLALVGAVLLVVAAVLLRGVLTDDDGGDRDGDDDGDLVVACIPELEAACQAIERDLEDLYIEDPAETIARVADGEDIDAWITLDPWPEIAEFDLRDDPFLDRRPELVASSQLTLVARPDVTDHCPEPPDWECVVRLEPGRVAIAAPEAALGRIVLGWAAYEWNRTTTGTDQFSRTELEQPALQTFLDGIDLTERDPLETALQLGLSGPRALGTTTADALAILGTREQGQLLPGPGGFPASVAVVVAGPDADRIAGEPAFSGALEAIGWTLDPTAGSSGLPNAGVLFALADYV